jgi:hypothetical protein
MSQHLARSIASAITKKAIELAKNGDLTALRLCLERIIPPRKDRPVNFDMPEIKTPSDAQMTREEKRERQRKRQREWYALKCATDPAWRDCRREYRRHKRDDPAWMERKRKLDREYKQRQRAADPVFRARELKWNREWWRKRATDPAWVERKRARQRARYAADPVFREHERKRRSELHRRKRATDPAWRQRELKRNYEYKRRKRTTDPVWLERRREQNREYNRRRRAAIISESLKSQILLLNQEMPNGKRMRYCTGTEMAHFGRGYQRIAKKAGVKMVGQVLDENEVRQLMD